MVLQWLFCRLCKEFCVISVYFFRHFSACSWLNSWATEKSTNSQLVSSAKERIGFTRRRHSSRKRSNRLVERIRGCSSAGKREKVKQASKPEPKTATAFGSTGCHFRTNSRKRALAKKRLGALKQPAASVKRERCWKGERRCFINARTLWTVQLWVGTVG